MMLPSRASVGEFGQVIDEQDSNYQSDAYEERDEGMSVFSKRTTSKSPITMREENLNSHRNVQFNQNSLDQYNQSLDDIEFSNLTQSF